MPNRLVETGSRHRTFTSRGKLFPARAKVNVQAKRCNIRDDNLSA
jgi:hypothetical protein